MDLRCNNEMYAPLQFTNCRMFSGSCCSRFFTRRERCSKFQCSHVLLYMPQIFFPRKCSDPGKSSQRARECPLSSVEQEQPKNVRWFAPDDHMPIFCCSGMSFSTGSATVGRQTRSLCSGSLQPLIVLCHMLRNTSYHVLWYMPQICFYRTCRDPAKSK